MSLRLCGVCQNALTGWCLLMRGTSKGLWLLLLLLRLLFLLLLLLWEQILLKLLVHTHIKLFLLCLMALCVDNTGVLLILPTHHVCLFFFTSRCVFVLREFPSAPRFSQFDISRTTVCYCFFLSVFLHSSAALLSNFPATNLTLSRPVSFFNHFFPPNIHKAAN